MNTNTIEQATLNSEDIESANIAKNVTDKITGFQITFNVDDKPISIVDVPFGIELVKRYINSRRTEESKTEAAALLLKGKYEVGTTAEIDPIQTACEALGFVFVAKKGGKKGSKIREVTIPDGITQSKLSELVERVLVPFKGQITGSISLPNSFGAVQRTLILTFKV
jgi:hypothetical protein